MRILRGPLAFAMLLAPCRASQLIDGSIETKLLPKPVEYSVLLPDGYESATTPVPLVLFLHGGGSDRSFLRQFQPTIDAMWKAGTLPKMVFATPSAGRSFYMDYKDGSQKWETFVLGPFLDTLRQKYRVVAGRNGTLLFGISMGGLGALRLGFKYPNRFLAAAALEPGIDPALKWRDVKPRNAFWRAPELMTEIFGKPFDDAYWEANNPASIADAKFAAIRSSGFGVYIDAGDEDFFNLHEATEFLHRLLWDHGVPHEYHLIRGANHVGRTLPPRTMEGLAFLARMVNPPGPDPRVEALEKQLGPLKPRE